MKKILLLINPKSRKGSDSFDEAAQILQEQGYFLLNSKKNLEQHSMHELIIQHRDNIDVVAIGGGDGSVNTALSALVETQIPMVLIPLGTANNMARTLNIPIDIKQSLDILNTGEIHKIDLGIVNKIYFVNVAGLGLSTEINRKVPSDLKKQLGVFAFVWTALQLSYKMRPFRTYITCDGKTVQRRSWQITVCNGKYYGSGLTIAESASLTDGRLDCLSTEMRKWWQGFFLIPRIIKGNYQSTEELSLFQGQNITIKTRRPKKIDVDGDIQTYTPAVFSVSPKALAVYIPKN
ncbi:MAG: lipid kinase [Pseudomonadota bacterium]